MALGSRPAARLTNLSQLLAGLLLLLVVSPALAQDAATQQAKTYFDDGQSLYVKGKFGEAAAKFEQAYNTKALPAFLFNVAVCHEKNKAFQKALKFYEQFLKADPKSRDKGLVEKRIASIRSHLSNPKPPTGTTTTPAVPTLPPIETKGIVLIESQPEGAAIYLNDKTSGIFTRTPYSGSLPPGRHTIILELKEYTPVRKTVFVRNDRMSYLYFSLSRQKNLGWIEVKGNIPGANIYFDERKAGAVGRSPYSGYLRPGKRTIIVDRPGYEPFTKVVNVIAGKTHVVDFSLDQVVYGWVKVTGRTTEKAQVVVDGKPIKCEGYPCRSKIAVGKHKVVIKRDGFKDYETNIDVARAAEVQVAVRLNPKPSRVKAWVTIGAAVAILGAGIGAGVYSAQRKSGIEDDIKNGVLFDSGDKRFTEGQVSAIIANGCFAISGIVAALGMYYLFRNEGPDSYGETRVNKIAIQPMLGPSVAGLSGKVRW